MLATALAVPSLPAPAGSRACRALPPEGAPRITWRPPNLVPAQPRVAAEKARPQTQIVYTRALQDLASWLHVDCLPRLDETCSDEILVAFSERCHGRQRSFFRLARLSPAPLWGLPQLRGPPR